MSESIATRYRTIFWSIASLLPDPDKTTVKDITEEYFYKGCLDGTSLALEILL